MFTRSWSQAFILQEQEDKVRACTRLWQLPRELEKPEVSLC